MDDEDELSEEGENQYGSSSSDEDGIARNGPVTLRNRGSVSFVRAAQKPNANLNDESEGEDLVHQTNRGQSRSKHLSSEYDEDFDMDADEDDAMDLTKNQEPKKDEEYRPSFGRNRNHVSSTEPTLTGTMKSEDDYRPSFASFAGFRRARDTEAQKNRAPEPRRFDDIDDDYRPTFRRETSEPREMRTGEQLIFRSVLPTEPESSNTASASAAGNSKDAFGRDVPRELSPSDTIPDEKSARDSANHDIKLLLRNQLKKEKKIQREIQSNSEAIPGKHITALGSKSTGPPRPADGSSTYSSMAQRYLEKFNFSGRLGKHGQGIAAPIEVKARPEGAGLGSVEEASSLPANRANTEHLERIRREAEQKEAKERKLVEEHTTLLKSWVKPIDEPNVLIFSSTEIAKAIHEETVGDGTTAAINRSLLLWTERAENLKREIAVTEAVSTMKQKEHVESMDELQGLGKRISTLTDMIGMLSILREERPSPSTLKRLLTSLQNKFSHELLEEYELQRIPSLLIRHCISKFWDSDQDFCLDMIEMLEELGQEVDAFFTPVNCGTLSTLMKCVVPKLNQAAEKWTLDASNQLPLHLLFLPWLPHLTAGLDSILVAPVRALERELAKNDLDLTNIDAIKAVIEPWREICGGQAFVHELMARTFGSRLFESRDIRLARLWYDEGLLNREDFACICENTLQLFVRDSPFTVALDQFAIARAARLYADIKEEIPFEALEDSCCQGRLRHIFQYALEQIRGKMDGKTIDRSIAFAIEPAPVSFSDAWYRNRISASKPVEVASDFTSAATLQNTVESAADALGKDFYAHPSGKKVDGKKVYVLGRTNCYFDGGVIFASSSMKEWKPISLEKLLVDS